MNRRHFLKLSLAAAVVAALPACGDDASADEPPEITYGEDQCDRCRMIISEERHAAALVDTKGTATLFDDTGEMIASVQQESLGERRAWVHDYESKAWVDATRAFYVDSHMLVTPMGTSIVAFADRQQAETVATNGHGTLRDWPTVLAEWKMHAHAH
jgi:copper chaperone NosL